MTAAGLGGPDPLLARLLTPVLAPASARSSAASCAGGPRVCAVNVPLFATSLEPYHERIVERLLDVAASGQLHPRARGRWPSSTSSPTTSASSHVVGVGNGTDALTIALRALGVPPGDEVVCPSLTFYATAEADRQRRRAPGVLRRRPGHGLHHRRHRPAAPDRAHEGDRAGAPVRERRPVPELRELGLPVLEDAAQAAGAALGGVQGRAPSATPPRSASSRRRTCPAWATAAAMATDSDEVADRARDAPLPRLARQAHAHATWATTRASTRSRRRCCACCCRSSTAGTPAAARPPRPTTRRASPTCVAPLATTPGAEHVHHLYVVRSEQADELAAALTDRGRRGARLLPHARRTARSRWRATPRPSCPPPTSWRAPSSPCRWAPS